MYCCLKRVMMLTKFLFRRENLMASLLFCIVTYGLLSTWLRLVHAINEKVESTLPSSLLIRVFIIIAALSFFLQKKPGVLKSFIAITFCLILLFLQAITGNDSNLLIVFYVQIMPDDFVMQLHRF